MEYNTIFAKSFSRYEQKKFGFGAFLGGLIIFLTVLTVFRPSFNHLPILNMRVSMHTRLAMLMFEDTNPQLSSANFTTLHMHGDVENLPASIALQPDDSFISEVEIKPVAEGDIKQEIEPLVENRVEQGTELRAEGEIKQETEPVAKSEVKQESESVAKGEVNQETEPPLRQGTDPVAKEVMQETEPVAKLEVQQGTKPHQGTDPAAEEVKQETEQVAKSEVQQGTKPAAERKITRERKPVCNVLEPRSDFCNMDRRIRIQGSSSTVFFSDNFAGNESWKIKPYARKGDNTCMGHVTELSVKPIAENQAGPRCSVNHSIPAVVFSSGGYAGNHFHDFADIIVPLFITSRQFDGKVQFVVTNAKQWWFDKYKTILTSLSRYEIIDMDKENEVHCFPSAIVGLYQNFTELRVHPSDTPKGYSMTDFRQFLRRAYSLKRKKAIRLNDRTPRKPKLLLISRNRTRSFTNQGEIVGMARSLGFAVTVAEPGMGSLSKFAELVNTCDVMMGVHGAGLTNLVFLPTNAILIQIVPWGNLEWICSHYFGEPAVDMKLRYLEYKIKEEESTLIELYPHDHPVLRDPVSIHKQGWNSLKATYLVKQNVKLDVNRFRGTLLKALKLLHR